MRGVLLSLAFSFVLLLAAPARPGATAVSHDSAISASSTSAVYALQIPDTKVDITIGKSGGGGRWYRNPMWIAIGAIGAIVVLLLIVLVARGGGTTVVKG
jgi:hypothetical protein